MRREIDRGSSPSLYQMTTGSTEFASNIKKPSIRETQICHPVFPRRLQPAVRPGRIRPTHLGRQRHRNRPDQRHRRLAGLQPLVWDHKSELGLQLGRHLWRSQRCGGKCDPVRSHDRSVTHLQHLHRHLRSWHLGSRHHAQRWPHDELRSWHRWPDRQPDHSGRISKLDQQFSQRP